MQIVSAIFAAQAVEDTRLHFSGDLSWWMALILAVIAGVAAWVLYRSDLKGRTTPGLWILPLLRVGAVMLVVMMLSGPVVQRNTTVGNTARVLLYVDASASMKATDEQMELSRKLKIIRRLGWIQGEGGADPAGDALDRLVALRQALAQLESGTTRDSPEYVRQCQTIAQQAQDQLEALKLPGWDPDQARQFRDQVATPIQKLDPERLTAVDHAVITPLRPLVAAVETALASAMPSEDDTLAAVDAETRAALERFDRTPRWQRMESQLLDGADSLVQQLSARHNVELLALTGRRFQMLWHPEAIEDPEAEGESAEGFRPPPDTLEVPATNMVSDLVTGIEQGVVPDGSQERIFVVLLTDGQHNADGASPLDLARQLRDRQVPVHTVGMGTVEPARDLSVLMVESPPSVYPDARLAGHVVVHDGMPAGQPFSVRIEHKGAVVWQQDFTTAQKRRKIPFDFAVKEIVDAEQAIQRRDLRFANLPLSFNVVIPPIPGEMKEENNVGVLRVNAVTQKPRILYVDSRPRWEYRYLKNMLERDERWDSNVILCDWAGGGPVLGPRGNAAGQFPNTRELLFQYQLVILGDVPSEIFLQQELQWIREFVQFNGGGLICLDGRMERHVNFMNTPLRDLYPVQFAGTRALSSMDLKLQFRSAGGAQAPLMLAADTAANLKIWNELPGPRWAAVTQALPGAETLLQIRQNNTVIPGLVFRRFGAGRVLYSAFDETWRWRFNVADLHHQRYWNQVAKWIMEPPFAVQDAYIAMDSGPNTYDVKDTAEIRVRIMNPQLAMQYQQNPNLKPEAVLMRDGRVFGTLPLEPDPESFTYRAQSPPLEAGEYEVKVRLPGVPEEAVKASTAFTVASNPFGELGRLHCDELTLRQMAADSGGNYFREEDLRRLVDVLGPASDQRDIVEETVLWQSYWWFVPVMLLLTLEWVLRRVKGLV